MLVLQLWLRYCEKISSFSLMGSQVSRVLLQFVSVREKLVMSPRGSLAGRAGLLGDSTVASPQPALGLFRTKKDSLEHLEVFRLELPLNQN